MKIEIRQFGPGGVVVNHNGKRQVKIKEVREDGERILPISDRGESFFGKAKRFLYVKKNRLFLAAGLATLLVAAGSTLLLTRDTLENRLYQRYYEPLNDNPANYFIENTAFSEAKRKYVEGEPNIALLLLQGEGRSQIKSHNLEKRFYKGLFLMEMESYREAAECFESVLQEPKAMTVHGLTGWYLGLTYLKLNAPEKVAEAFSYLAADNSKNFKKSRKILGKLEK